MMNGTSNQRVTGDGNTTTVNQWGSNNKAYGLSIGDENTVLIWQNGNNNQSGTNTFLGLGLLQIGNKNKYDIDQTGESNLSKALQLGNSDNIRAYQSDFNRSLAETSNSASIQQFGDHNNSGIAQDGNSSITDIIQNSDYSESNLIQWLDDNFARIEQKTGNMNKVNLTQTDGAQAVINQFGAGNILMGLGSSVMALSLDESTLD